MTRFYLAAEAISELEAAPRRERLEALDPSQDTDGDPGQAL
jgi:hypothetical protein